MIVKNIFSTLLTTRQREIKAYIGELSPVEESFPPRRSLTYIKFFFTTAYIYSNIKPERKFTNVFNSQNQKIKKSEKAKTHKSPH